MKRRLFLGSMALVFVIAALLLIPSPSAQAATGGGCTPSNQQARFLQFGSGGSLSAESCISVAQTLMRGDAYVNFSQATAKASNPFVHCTAQVWIWPTNNPSGSSNGYPESGSPIARASANCLSYLLNKQSHHYTGVTVSANPGTYYSVFFLTIAYKDGSVEGTGDDACPCLNLSWGS